MVSQVPGLADGSARRSLQAKPIHIILGCFAYGHLPHNGLTASLMRLVMYKTNFVAGDHPIYDGAKRNGIHRFVQKMITGGAGLTHRLRIGVAADEKSRNSSRKRGSQPLYDIDPSLAVRQPIIGNDQ